MTIKSKKMKYVLGVVGAILVGAIGSGIWSVVLEPFFNMISEATINSIFYLFASLENSFYKSVSRGYNEETSFMAVSLIFYIYWGLLGLLAYQFVGKHKIDKKGFFSSIDKDLDEVEHLEYPKQKLDEIKSKLENYKNKLRKKGYILFSLITLLLVFVYSQSIMIKLRTEKIADYYQRITIIKPFITVKDYDRYNSLFSQVKIRKDYESLMDSLRSVGRKNNVVLE